MLVVYVSNPNLFPAVMWLLSQEQVSDLERICWVTNWATRGKTGKPWPKAAIKLKGGDRKVTWHFRQTSHRRYLHIVSSSSRQSAWLSFLSHAIQDMYMLPFYSRPPLMARFVYNSLSTRSSTDGHALLNLLARLVLSSRRLDRLALQYPTNCSMNPLNFVCLR